MSKIIWKGGALLAPVPPVLVTCRFGKNDNIFTVGWTGIINTKPPKTYISVRPSRFSYDIIKNSGVFAVNLPSDKMVRAVDYCGVKSGRDIDKFNIMSLKTEQAQIIDCPILTASPVTMECKVFDIVRLGTHDMFMADIVSVSVSEDLVNQSGRLMLDRAGLLAYAHGEYFTLGKKIGSFGYSVRKRKKNNKPKQ